MSAMPDGPTRRGVWLCPKRVLRPFSDCFFTGSERHAETRPVRDILFQHIPHKLCKKFQKPIGSTKNLQKVPEACHFVCACAVNAQHQAPKTPVVEHKGNVAQLSAPWVVGVSISMRFRVAQSNDSCCALRNGALV